MDETKEEQFDGMLADIKREDVENLAKSAGILATWMTERRYTIAEQLVITELVRASLVSSYVLMVTQHAISKTGERIVSRGSLGANPVLN